MKWSKRVALGAALLVSSVVPASAQVTGRPFEVSAGAGLMAFDTRTYIKDAPTYGLSLGWRWSPWVSFDAALQYTMSESTVGTSGADHEFGYLGLDVRWHLRPAEDKVVPYLLTGVGYASSESDARSPVSSEGMAGSLGIGLLYNLLGNPRTYLRLQVRDMLLRDRTTDLVNDFAVTAAFHYVIGGKYKDVDYDSVRDWLDNCPLTPIGATVTAEGCPTDADRDSVWDGVDQCDSTAFGCKVDDKGCPLDADGDKVCDGIDKCADTPLGAAVDSLGCTADSDGDGVLDGLDQCADTPKGATIDALGCSVDTDGDGVADGIDQCAKTPKNVPVDERGCPTPEGLLMIELMDSGKIRLQNVKFATGSANLVEEAKPVLDVVGGVLLKMPTLNFEIGGHTDNQGGADLNRRLSESRAKSVRDYLLGRFPEINRERLSVRGYGSSKAIAPNTTEAGRVANRRVEFVVTNRDELLRIIRGEPAPTPEKTPEGGN